MESLPLIIELHLHKSGNVSKDYNNKEEFL